MHERQDMAHNHPQSKSPHNERGVRHVTAAAASTCAPKLRDRPSGRQYALAVDPVVMAIPPGGWSVGRAPHTTFFFFFLLSFPKGQSMGKRAHFPWPPSNYAIIAPNWV